MNKPNFLIYGANGYTAKLILRIAAARGLKPILAGRSEKSIKPLAEQYQLDYEICDLSDTAKLNDTVLLADVVLNCAGPFENTFKPMIKACIKNKAHYVDITGEMAVFEQISKLDDSLKEAEIMALPGAGFDVVPTDCLAAYLKNQLPSATHLELAFMGVGGGVSRGTATTALLNMGKGKGGAIRKDGYLQQVPSAYKTKKIIFKKSPVLSATIPWGDVSTAYHSTGIPNIEVYMAVTPFMLRMMKWTNSANWIFKRQFAKKILQMGVNARSEGPTDEQRKKGRSFIWGRVYDEAGNQKEARIQTVEGYTLTAITALNIVEKAMKGDAPHGFQTPSKAYGQDLIMEVRNTIREDIAQKRSIRIG